jgi:hypothetical protein
MRCFEREFNLKSKRVEQEQEKRRKRGGSEK